jgi:hypothetical protein
MTRTHNAPHTRRTNRSRAGRRNQAHIAGAQQRWFREGYIAPLGAPCPYKAGSDAAKHWQRGQNKALGYVG